MLDLASVQEKLVDSRRGGYCFEQNVLLKAALETMGFKVMALGGRVRWMSPPESPLGPREHMLLMVDLPDGQYLADVGFGACLLDSPQRFKNDVEQRTAMGTYRLSEADGLFSLSAKQPSGWRTNTCSTWSRKFNRTMNLAIGTRPRARSFRSKAS
jgi:N-hydroxyarylamine O-acetyltransferase